MPRTIAALYDSRAEAELARARLLSEVKPKSQRILGKDTAAAVDSLNFSRSDADAYREGLRRGCHLLVAQVPSGANVKRIIALLEESAGDLPDAREERAWGDADQGVQVRLPDEGDQVPAAPTVESQAAPEPEPEPGAEGEIEVQQSAGAHGPADATVTEEPVADPRVPVRDEELRVGKREVARGGTRVRSVLREDPVEQQVSLTAEFVDVESRPCERRLSDEEIEAGGLFKDRVFEIAEMREEPVVTKTAVVREEVIVRKRVTERTETVRDVLRHTEVAVEEFAGAEGVGPTLFRPARTE